MRPLVRELIFFTFQLVPPNITSVFQRRSPSHHDPHSTGTYLKFGYLSNFPESRNCHSGRWVQNATSSMYWAMFSLYASASASPEWVCTTRPVSWQACQIGSYFSWPYDSALCHIVGIMIPLMPGLSARA